MFGFDSERLYRPQDDEMRQIGSVGQLAQWRFHNRGLPFIRVGTKIFYAGADIIRWLDQCRVATTDMDNPTPLDGKTRLEYQSVHHLMADIGCALEALDYDADARTQVLAGLQAAHAHLQDQLSEELDVTVSKI